MTCLMFKKITLFPSQERSVAGPESVLADQLKVQSFKGKIREAPYIHVCVLGLRFCFLFFLQVDHKASLPLSYICLDKTVTLRGEKLLIALSSSFYKKKKKGQHITVLNKCLLKK